MRIAEIFSPLCALGLAAALAATTASPALAQPAAPVVATAAQLVNVSSCDPQRSVNLPQYAGFTPGFYPLSPFGWTDPYGFRYEQFPPTAASGALSIDYMNVSTKVMTTIDFGLVARGRLVAEIRDVGKFSPQAEIKHQFGLDPNVFPLRTARSQCIPLHIVFADGTSWKNPHLPAAQQAMYHHRHH